MPVAAIRGVVLLAAPGALEGVDRYLAKSRIELYRVEVLRQQPVPPSAWLPRVARAGPIDTVLVTSRFAVGAGVLPWRHRRNRIAPPPEFWAAGPRTAEALRRLGIPKVRHGSTLGSAGIVAKLGRRHRRILYLRSDQAGPSLARALRGRGHRVTDVVVYRVEARSSLREKDRRRIRNAAVLVATSSSAITGLRRGIGSPTFRSLARSTPMVVLGPQTARRARALGFRSVSVAPGTGAQRFTRHLLRELNHARP